MLYECGRRTVQQTDIKTRPKPLLSDPSGSRVSSVCCDWLGPAAGVRYKTNFYTEYYTEITFHIKETVVKVFLKHEDKIIDLCE